MTKSRLRRPMSKSITTIVWPVCASAAPKAAVDVVLPTPPFPDVTTTTLPNPSPCCFSRLPPPLSYRRRAKLGLASREGPLRCHRQSCTGRRWREARLRSCCRKYVPASSRSRPPWPGREARHRHGSNRRRRSRRPKPRDRPRLRHHGEKPPFDLSGLDRRAAARLLAASAPCRSLFWQELED